MAFNLKEKKGSTIVEVLVSVIIIGIVSVYGLSFFSSAYKHSVDSRDYSFVLHDLVRKMEMVKGGGYPNPDATNINYYPPATSVISQGDNDKTTYDFKVDKLLRDNCQVHYTCRVYLDERTIEGHTYRFGMQIVCEASWPWNNGQTLYPATIPADKNKITLVTYVAEPKNNNIGEF